MKPASGPSLAVDDLSCRRGERSLFDGLCFAAAGGTLVSVRGANGSGKTSLLRLLAGFGIPTRGTITWQGCEAAGSVGWLGHADGLKGDLSARENLAFHGSLYGAPADGVEAAVVAAGLIQHADLPTRHLSAGQRRRVALARLLVAPVPVWLLDEPLTALDAEGQDWVHELVAGQCRNGGLVALTSHQTLRVDVPTVEVSW